MSDRRLEEAIFADQPGPLTMEADPYPRQPHRHRRKRTWRRWLALLLAMSLVAGGGFLAVSVLRPVYNQLTASKDYPGPGSGQVQVVVRPGDSGRAIAATLLDAGVVKTTSAFVDAAKADPSTANAIQPGTYTMSQEMSASDALAALVDPANRVADGVTIREGLWAQEIYPILSKATGISVADYVAAAKDIEGIGLPASAKGNVEGWLFPSTYEFPDGSDAVEQLAMMVAQTKKNLMAAGLEQKDWQSTLVLASIVEAEAKRSEDRAKVARVVNNRLSKAGPPPYGYLQLDSTVSYGVKHRAITTTDAERASKNAWNTYLRPGLPVGPIDNPGLESIVAAAHPTSGPWLYFVAVDPETGETEFATTAQEHAASVAKFQAWCKAHPGKC
ncbi:MAG: endolytic transglycosylase MltG [Nostocoides sp.]